MSALCFFTEKIRHFHQKGTGSIQAPVFSIDSLRAQLNLLGYLKHWLQLKPLFFNLPDPKIEPSSECVYGTMSMSIVCVYGTLWWSGDQ